MGFLSRKPLVVGGLIIACSLAAFVLSRDDASAVTDLTFSEDAHAAEIDQVQVEPLHPVLLELESTARNASEAASSEATSQPAEREARVVIPEAVFSGVLVDEDDQPIPGARLSWTSYSTDLFHLSTESVLGHWTIDESWFEENTVWADSGIGGEFSFHSPPASSEGRPSVIWATHIDHLATPILLAADPSPQAFGERVVMSSSPRMTGQVVDGAGAPAQGATVDAFAVVPSSTAIQVALEPEQLIALFLRRSYETDGAGRTNLSPFPGETFLQARRGEDTSKAWTGKARPLVKLALAPSFIAEGRLTLTDGGEFYPGELSVAVEGWSGSFSQSIAKTMVDEDSLTWGPFRIPLTGEDRYSFSLRTLSVIPQRRFVPTPKPGDKVVVDFESSIGHEVWFGLVDESDKYLSEGTVELSWEPPNDYGTMVLRLRADGFIRCLACPEGPIQSIRGSSPGYSASTLPGFDVPEKEPALHVLTLSDAAQITGRVLANGSPVNDFEVVLWPTEASKNVARKRVVGSKDGSFVIDQAPIGEVQILAAASLSAPSKPQVITVVQGETNELELVLQTPHSARGRVADETGAPLPAAAIQLLFEDDWKSIAKWGAPIEVDPGGQFQLNGLPPGRICFSVSAPGYSPHEQWAQVKDGQLLDLKTIRLSRLRDLEIRFLFPPDVDPTQYSAKIGHPGFESAQAPLNDKGTVIFERASTSTETVWLMVPNLSVYGLDVPKPTGRDWIVEHPMTGTGRVVIDVDRDSYDGKLPINASVLLDSYARGEDSMVIGHVLSNIGIDEVIFDHVVPGAYLAKLSESGFHVSGSTLLKVVSGETTYATIAFDNEDSVFRVVDRHGDPIPGVALSLYATEYPLWRRTVSNQEGLCTVGGSPAMNAFAGLQHADIGDLWGIPVELGKGADSTIELEFVAKHAIKLRLMDGNVPLGGITCRLNAPGNSNVDVSFPRESAPDGRVEFESLGKAQYGVKLRGPGVWETKLDIEATNSSATTTVQLRRLGDLSFQITGASGQPHSGISIELIAVDFDTTAEAWIEQGKLRTVPASTRTDVSGRLIFPAIPHGNYRWLVTAPNGDVLTGAVQLPVGHAVVPISLP